VPVGMATLAGMTVSEPETVGVLVVDDDPLVRAGLVMMLGGAPDVRVVGEASDGTQVLPVVDRHAPDVVLMDIRMPNMDGLAATEALRARRSAPEVIVLTTFDADEHVLRALRAGVAGFVLKDTPPAEIVDAVRRVAQGLPILFPAVTRHLIAQVAGSRATTAAPGPGSAWPWSTTASARWPSPSARAAPTPRSGPSSTSASPPSRPTSRASSPSSTSTTGSRSPSWPRRRPPRRTRLTGPPGPGRLRRDRSPAGGGRCARRR
jgi:DNA-binding NarL/FixJ family response regulator